MNPLVTLLNNINANTLTATEQGALTQALGVVIPMFPTPDELASALPPPDELSAREWIAALYTIQGNDGGGPMTFARVITPNAETALPAPFAPGVGGKVLLVADITPQSTGLLLVSVNLAVIEDAAGVPAIAAIFVDNLTAVTGGTPIAPGLTAEPTSTTPAFGAGVDVFAVEQASFADGSNPHNAILTLASLPVQAVVGHRVGIIIVALDTGAQNWTSIAASVSVIEAAS